jgi:hypothetical protein
VHACTFFPSDFVSIEIKGMEILIPKLKVPGSIPVARSISSQLTTLPISKKRDQHKRLAGLAFE